MRQFISLSLLRKNSKLGKKTSNNELFDCYWVLKNFFPIILKNECNSDYRFVD